MNIEEQYNMLIEGLKLLSVSYEDQVSFLPEFADVPDDVIGSFENAFLLLPQLVENNKLSNRVISSILRTYNKMQWCLRNVELDDFSNDEWNRLRELSKESVRLLEKENTSSY